jgi:hypothetical protein
VGETPTEYRSRIKIEKKYKSELLWITIKTQ